VTKGMRRSRQKIGQAEFERERAFLFGCVHFCPLSFHHLCSLPKTIVVAIMPHRCSDVKSQKVVNFSQNGGIFVPVHVSSFHVMIYRRVRFNRCRFRLGRSRVVPKFERFFRQGKRGEEDELDEA